VRKGASGVTLVELMVTLAVLAILVSVGYPMYTAQILKSRRSEARSGIMALAMAEERERRAWGGYTESNATIAHITFADNSPVPDANSTFDKDVTSVANEFGQFYSFKITADNSTYTISATPTGTQGADTACASFSIDQTGAKSATDTDLCW
jgi:type IV pilus assembly protein PilE